MIRAPHRLRYLTAASIVACVLFALSLWREQRAGERAIARASEILDAPFEEAPDLADLAISDAAEAMRIALSVGAVPPPGLADEIEAFEYWLAGDLIFADGALGEARQGDRWTLRRRLLAAAIARSAGRSNEAWDHALEAVASAPEAPRALLMMADLALDRNDYRAALTAMRHIASNHDSLAVVQNRLGLALEGVGDGEAAMRAFERATAFDGELHVAFINLGRVYRSRGRLIDAKVAFENALALQDGDPDAWIGAGLVAMERDDISEAAAAFERASELAPYDDAGLLALGDLAASKGENTAAVRHYRRAISRQDRNPASFVKLGNVLVRRGSMRDALLAFEEAIALDEHLAAAYNGQGTVLAALGRGSEAQVALRRSAELDDRDPHPWMNLALLQARLGQSDAAASSWNAARQRDPSVRAMPRFR